MAVGRGALRASMVVAFPVILMVVGCSSTVETGHAQPVSTSSTPAVSTTTVAAPVSSSPAPAPPSSPAAAPSSSLAPAPLPSTPAAQTTAVTEQPANSGPLASPGTVCGQVESQFGDTLPVSVIEGLLDCGQAIRVAESYLLNAPNMAQGTSAMIVAEDWLCGRASLPDRGGFEQPTECVPPEGEGRIRIGT